MEDITGAHRRLRRMTGSEAVKKLGEVDGGESYEYHPNRGDVRAPE
jgi:hypothetical protein